jgi:hypothetical protein
MQMYPAALVDPHRPAAGYEPNFPAYVTDGINPDGTLRVLVFHSRADADAAGFDWVGW